MRGHTVCEIYKLKTFVIGKFLKKILACAASIAMIAGAVPGITRNPMSDLPASVITADAVTYGNLTYQVSGDHVIITACNTDASTVTVPSSFNGALPCAMILASSSSAVR